MGHPCQNTDLPNCNLVKRYNNLSGLPIFLQPLPIYRVLFTAKLPQRGIFSCWIFLPPCLSAHSHKASFPIITRTAFGKPAATSVLLSSLVTSLSLWYLTLRCHPGELILPCHITSASTGVHDPTFSRPSYHLTSSAFSDFFVNFFPVVWNAPGHF